MAYFVRWQLVGRSGGPLDKGSIGESFCGYGDALATVFELLRPYAEVNCYLAESYWLARRSRDADLAVWVWIENHEPEEATPIVSARIQPSVAESETSALCCMIVL
jgi:hypothetical protein